MAAGGSVLFSDVRDFGSHFPGGTHLVMAGGTPFHARLTWMELGSLLLVHARETIRRVGYISLPIGRTSMFFPVDQRSVLVCDGTEIRAREIVFYQGGSHMHQRTLGPIKWSSVSLETTVLRSLGTIHTDQDSIGASGTVLRAVAADWKLFKKLHSEAIRIAETQLPHIHHPQVARALEQELIWALMNCLSNAKVIDQMTDPKSSDVLVRFETCLAKHTGELLPVSAICKCIHVSERALGELCSRVLGMGPARYQRLRRALNPGPHRATTFGNF
jgi:hypothetical protein